MKLFILCLTLLSTTSVMASDSVLEARVLALEARVARLEVSGGGNNSVYCYCNALSGYSAIGLYRVSGSTTTMIGKYYPIENCEAALRTHRACK